MVHSNIHCFWSRIYWNYLIWDVLFLSSIKFSSSDCLWPWGFSKISRRDWKLWTSQSEAPEWFQGYGSYFSTQWSRTTVSWLAEISQDHLTFIQTSSINYNLAMDISNFSTSFDSSQFFSTIPFPPPTLVTY